MTEIERKTIQDIKDYVKSLNTPDNKVYQNNELLIMPCFAKAIEIVERNAQLSESDVSKRSNCCNATIDTDEQSCEICSNCGDRIE
jgi:hypothetical protein